MSNSEKVMVSNGCHDCIFQQPNHKGYEYCVILDELVDELIDAELRHCECPLLENDIKVVSSSQNIIGVLPINPFLKQESLGEEFETVLYDNLWELYKKSN